MREAEEGGNGEGETAWGGGKADTPGKLDRKKKTEIHSVRTERCRRVETHREGRGQKARDGGGRETGEKAGRERGGGRADGKRRVGRSLIPGPSSAGEVPRAEAEALGDRDRAQSALDSGGLGAVLLPHPRAPSIPAPYPRELTLQVLLHQRVRVALPGQLGQFLQGVLVAQHQLLLGGLPEAFGHLPGWGVRGR